jgi:hypothetical protein
VGARLLPDHITLTCVAPLGPCATRPLALSPGRAFLLPWCSSPPCALASPPVRRGAHLGCCPPAISCSSPFMLIYRHQATLLCSVLWSSSVLGWPSSTMSTLPLVQATSMVVEHANHRGLPSLDSLFAGVAWVSLAVNLLRSSAHPGSGHRHQRPTHASWLYLYSSPVSSLISAPPFLACVAVLFLLWCLRAVKFL